jgi:hypothetical protein
VGLASYAVSYVLVAANDRELGVTHLGYNCAVLSLVGPPALVGQILKGQPVHPYTDHILAGLSAVLCFFVNPAFFLFVFLQLVGAAKLATIYIRPLVLCLILVCWVFMFYSEWYPREGHIFWILGMALVLYSSGPFKKA